MAQFTAGQRLRASEINAALARPVFKLARTSDLSAPPGDLIIPWQSAEVDSDGVWNPGQAQVATIRNAGVWLLVLAIRWSTFDGRKGAYVTLNGTDLITDTIVAATSEGTSILQASGVVQLSAGDELRCTAAHDVSGGLVLRTDYGNTYLTGTWLGEPA